MTTFLKIRGNDVEQPNKYEVTKSYKTVEKQLNMGGVYGVRVKYYYNDMCLCIYLYIYCTLKRVENKTTIHNQEG